MSDSIAHSTALPNLHFFKRALEHAASSSKPAIVDIRMGRELTYSHLIDDTLRMKSQILTIASKSDLNQDRVAFLFPGGYHYTYTKWGIWAAGGISVPICSSHPIDEIKYTIEDSQPSILIAHEAFESRISQVAKLTGIDKVIIVRDVDVTNTPSRFSSTELVNFDINRNALMVYTSGTTGKPKGVVSTHANIAAQVTSLIQAWKWTSDDRILHCLPLHHVHGIINSLSCPLWVGATVEMHSKFDAGKIWERWIAEPQMTIFMAVPTIYSRLISHYDSLDENTKLKATEATSNHRLHVSGSAALPAPVKGKWKMVTNQALLERYGMTEIGMALSCEYAVTQRFDGCVGLPLPHVQVRLYSTDYTQSQEITQLDQEAEIQVKGPTVFKEYWQREEETKKQFTLDGWFKTGDIALRDSKLPGHPYRIMGRASVDIIKSGGFKISALDVERDILTYIPAVSDVAVVGVKDPHWGQRVAAVVVCKQGKTIDIETLRATLKVHIAPYKVPTLLKVYNDQLPRNAMGKVNKKNLVEDVFEREYFTSIQKA